jgi:hypothetical protein
VQTLWTDYLCLAAKMKGFGQLHSQLHKDTVLTGNFADKN